MTDLPILTVRLQQERHVVQARQRARDLACMLGFDRQDQVRIATAVSELARNAFRYARDGAVEFAVSKKAPRCLVIEVSDSGPGIAALEAILAGDYQSKTGLGKGLLGTRRLMDSFAVDSGPRGTRVRVSKELAGSPALEPSEVQSLKTELGKLDVDPFREVERQNQELVRALGELREQQEMLAQLNSELEKTNRGVVALYAELEQNAVHLHRISDRLHQVMEVTSDSILSIDRNWKITYMNPNATQAAGRTGVIGADFWTVFPAASFAGSPFRMHYGKAMEEGVPADFEAFYPAPLEEWVSASVRPTEDGVTLFLRNVTEQKKIAAALLQNEKLAAVGRLASSIAHEINNPLESVMNLLYLATSSQGLPEETRGYLRMAETELRRASAITNQTLRFHKQSTKPSVVRFEELVEGLLAIHQSRIVNSHVQVEERKRARRPVLCFEGEIQQVLANLIGNAIDAMHPKGGKLLIRSRAGHDWRSGRECLVITVADTGSGIAPDAVSKVFEAFYTTKGIGGTGLGLWISQDILSRHRGRMALRSRQVGPHRGTAFVVYLPYDAFETAGGTGDPKATLEG